MTFCCFDYGHLIEIIMHENFIITERYKLQDYISFHFIFAVNFIHDKNLPYGK